MTNSQQKFRQPHWWTDVHNKAWDHVREVFRSKWEEQRAADAQGESWEQVESPIRFGFGARRREDPELSSQQESDPDWDPELEATLEQEWDSMHDASEAGSAPHLWHDVRQFVHRGWLGP
ncbi:MAG TPA: hypothetical protein VG937_10035 [Polyangiaceae bacterium]|nr:hypothetical protein [Polyangiaceae bacterium]